MRTDLPTETEPVRVIEGESLGALLELPDGVFDLILNDPPYSSGGFTRADRQGDVSAKYQQGGTKRKYPTFKGDSRDQRAYRYWSALWLIQCLRVSKPGAICGVFTDWRQLPVTVDALQAGGWVYRGIVVWHKPGARPAQGRFANACEFLVWGTNGGRALAGSPFPGHFSHAVKQPDKHHLTGKPTALMQDLVRVVPPGGLVLDCFAGSGTTGVAAALEGRRAVLIEESAEYAAIARQRVAGVLV
ncbi:DNA methyltransferase [Gemmata sp. JC673]|uniref:Methyltransferase n=1 Tax=Gemmata algarum TaxID=2975278 RepID=A0ABU5ET24_9BACT|nr:DNA methyltransferase [Gemmata algarum]MDY3558113.1 DNA methyltransferase [Gemmata algarum]